MIGFRVRVRFARILRFQAAAERRAVRHLHLGAHQITVHASGRLDLDALERGDVPRHGAMDDNDAGENLGRDVGAEPDGQHMLRQ